VWRRFLPSSLGSSPPLLGSSPPLLDGGVEIIQMSEPHVTLQPSLRASIRVVHRPYTAQEDQLVVDGKLAGQTWAVTAAQLNVACFNSAAVDHEHVVPAGSSKGHQKEFPLGNFPPNWSPLSAQLSICRRAICSICAIKQAQYTRHTSQSVSQPASQGERATNKRANRVRRAPWSGVRFHHTVRLDCVMEHMDLAESQLHRIHSGGGGGVLHDGQERCPQQLVGLRLAAAGTEHHEHVGPDGMVSMHAHPRRSLHDLLVASCATTNNQL
jgi:hypothetical protein